MEILATAREAALAIAERASFADAGETSLLAKACGESVSTEDAARRLTVLSAIEERYAGGVVHDYLKTVQVHGMTEEWRVKIATWFHQLGDAFKLSATTLAYAMSFLDRYLSRKRGDGVREKSPGARPPPAEGIIPPLPGGGTRSRAKPPGYRGILSRDGAARAPFFRPPAVSLCPVLEPYRILGRARASTTSSWRSRRSFSRRRSRSRGP